MSTIQKLYKFFLSANSFNKARSESQEWYFKCDCGNEFSMWDIGGIRYKAKGNPIKVVKCTRCHKVAARKLFKK